MERKTKAAKFVLAYLCILLSPDTPDASVMNIVSNLMIAAQILQEVSIASVLSMVLNVLLSMKA